MNQNEVTAVTVESRKLRNQICLARDAKQRTVHEDTASAQNRDVHCLNAQSTESVAGTSEDLAAHLIPALGFERPVNRTVSMLQCSWLCLIVYFASFLQYNLCPSSCPSC